MGSRVGAAVDGVDVATDVDTGVLLKCSIGTGPVGSGVGAVVDGVDVATDVDTGVLLRCSIVSGVD